MADVCIADDSIGKPRIDIGAVEDAKDPRRCLLSNTSNKSFELTGRHELGALPSMASCLPLKASVRGSMLPGTD